MTLIQKLITKFKTLLQEKEPTKNVDVSLRQNSSQQQKIKISRDYYKRENPLEFQDKINTELFWSGLGG